MKTEHDKRKVSINSHLAKLQNLQDRQQDSNKQEEQQFSSNQGDMRKRVGLTGVNHQEIILCMSFNLFFARSLICTTSLTKESHPVLNVPKLNIPAGIYTEFSYCND